MKKIIILSNHHSYTYNFRKEIIKKFLTNGYKVYILMPYGEKVELLKEMGCEFIHIDLDRRGMNPFKDGLLFYRYLKVIKSIKPDAVLSYTIKPNLYGGLACRFLKIPFYPNVTGLGSFVNRNILIKKLVLGLLRASLKNAECIFFQNKENYIFFKEHKLINKRFRIIPGSGVNISDFKKIPYPKNDEKINFLFISRIMKEKGIDHYLEAAKYLKGKYSNLSFHVLGFCEEKYEEILKEHENQQIITYHGMKNNVKDYIGLSHCTIHPTYYPEGMSNVLLESAASGRPIITTDRSGCREIVDNHKNGYIAEQRSTNSLIEKIEAFLSLEYDEKVSMGNHGRNKIENEFDRQIIVEAYYEEVTTGDTIKKRKENPFNG